MSIGGTLTELPSVIHLLLCSYVDVLWHFSTVETSGVWGPIWLEMLPAQLVHRTCPIAQTTSAVSYHIAENFRGRKLSQIGEKYDFHWENLRRLLAFTMPKDTTPPNFVEKTFANSHKPRKFSPSKVSHYTVHAQCAQLMCFWFHLSPFLTPIIILIYHSCHWKPSTNCWSTNHWNPATNHWWR